MTRYEGRFPRYVSVGEWRAKAQQKLAAPRKKGKAIEPVPIEGRTIARTFWGKGWCDPPESFSDSSNRLPRGRMYVRNGSVCHLSVSRGRIEALASGTRLCTVDIRIRTLTPKLWKAIQRNCAGRIGSMLELIQGKLSDEVMTVVTDRKAGLFPGPRRSSSVAPARTGRRCASTSQPCSTMWATSWTSSRSCSSRCAVSTRRN